MPRRKDAEIRFLDYWCSQGFALRFDLLCKSRVVNLAHKGRSLRSAVRPCHYLQTIAIMPAWRKVVTPFFRLRPSSAEKEGKSASMTDCFKRKVRRADPHPNPLS